MHARAQLFTCQLRTRDDLIEKDLRNYPEMFLFFSSIDLREPLGIDQL